ncbi:MAG: chemotaxis protein CheC [Promethearchaeota archaeon]
MNLENFNKERVKKKMRKYNEKLDKSKIINLTPEQFDILKELGNIGSGHAITALSKFINSKIELSLTSVDIIPFWQIPNLFKNYNNNIVFGIFSKINRDTELSIIQFYSKESIINLINVLTVNERLTIDKINKITDLDEFSYSIIKEIGNIMAGHYSNALANLLSIKLIPNVPQIALDNINAILDSIIAKYAQISDYSIIIKTMIKINEIKLKGIICALPNLDFLHKLFEILNIKYSINI